MRSRTTSGSLRPTWAGRPTPDAEDRGSPDGLRPHRRPARHLALRRQRPDCRPHRSQRGRENHDDENHHGLLRPWAGSLSFDGEDLAALSPGDIVSLGISLVPEGRRIFSTLTVLENLKMGAYLHWARSRILGEVEAVLELFPALQGREKQKGGSLSGGEQQMLAIARALDVRTESPAPGRTLHGSRPPLDRDRFPDPSGHPEPGNDCPPGRAERAHGPRPRRRGLRHRDRKDCPPRYGHESTRESRSPPGLLGGRADGRRTKRGAPESTQEGGAD